MKKVISILPVTIIISVIFYTCSAVKTEINQVRENNGRYDTEFPTIDASKELDAISNTIQRISTVAFYDAYIFADSSHILYKDISSETLKDKATDQGFFDRTVAGTGIIIYSQNNNVGLITCSHIVDLPDTIISYFHEKDGSRSVYVESVSFKRKQLVYGAGFPEGGDLEIIAEDRVSDIAFIGQRYTEAHPKLFQVFKYPFGDSRLLDWGSFVYIFGFPLNYKMMTDAIVSSPDFDGNGNFILNAVINEGFSGGVILAIKDGIPNFELVGMIKSVPEESEFVLEPEKLKNNADYDPMVPYSGKTFVKPYSSLKYGIARVVPINAIKLFLDKNQSKLRDSGYSIKGLP
jgi:Trypsin-like peptidase domain